MTSVLFLCSQNKLRSPTAEQVFAGYPGIACTSAGLNHDAENPLTPEQLAWAELIFVMEKAQRSRLRERFGEHLHGQRVVCLNIPDNYRFMQPELVALLEKKVTPHLPA
ncbi:MAG: phosphotyrosine protein phosphatase [Uliginosibacterium sp.]|nr:phosphotyrosine protein phosphatase [Uliginosibacterium sp.]